MTVTTTRHMTAVCAMPAGQILLRGRGPNTSEALLLGGIKSEILKNKFLENTCSIVL